MKFEQLSRADIDDRKWNDSVISSQWFRHYALTYYLDNACDSWVGLVGGDYDWVWPLPIKRFPVERIFQPLLAQQLGPFGSLRLSPENICQVLDYLQQHYKGISIKFNEGYDKVPCMATERGRNIELLLNSSYDQIVEGYSRTIRSNLKKSSKAQIRLEESTDFDGWSIKTFKRFRGKEIKILDHRFYQQVEAVFREFILRGEGFAINAIDPNNECIAQSLFLNTNGRLLLFFSATDYQSPYQGAMHTIIDHVIRTYSESDVTLDFEGSNDDNLAYFYRAFGGSEKVYLHGKYSRLPWPFNRLLKL